MAHIMRLKCAAATASFPATPLKDFPDHRYPCAAFKKNDDSCKICRQVIVLHDFEDEEPHDMYTELCLSCNQSISTSDLPEAREKYIRLREFLDENKDMLKFLYFFMQPEAKNWFANDTQHLKDLAVMFPNEFDRSQYFMVTNTFVKWEEERSLRSLKSEELTASIVKAKRQIEEAEAMLAAKKQKK